MSTDTIDTIAFAGSLLDRADHVRQSPDQLSALMTPRARLLLLDGLDPVISDEGALRWGSLADAHPEAELVFLGLGGGHGHFAAVPQAGSTAPANPRLWQAMASLGGEELATYGGARSIVDWHARHRHCARCGALTVLAKGGWQRNCTSEACKAEHFPRVDPVTIMLVEHDDAILLGRQPRFPEGNYSALAGFVEPGETIEEAVAREVKEEAGVTARNVTYVMSQPWPFPSSLMIGCHAYADDPAIVVDTNELEDARWFPRADIAEALTAAKAGGKGRAVGIAAAHRGRASPDQLVDRPAMNAATSTPAQVTIEIFSDVMCPWCVIGYKQLEQALGTLAGEVEAEVRWQPFELNPDMPPEGEDAGPPHRPQVWPRARSGDARPDGSDGG